MNQTATKQFGNYRFGMAVKLSENHLVQLIALFEENGDRSASVLEGRTGVRFKHLAGIGPVAVKSFFRGGLASRFVKKSYLNIGKTRGQREFETLLMLRSIGFQVPEPIAWADTGGLFCRTWLISRKIDAAISLAALAGKDRQTALKALDSVADMIEKMITRHILHVDLHPGNILVSDTGNVFIIDFDRAKIYKRPRSDLHRRYAKRWQRAVTKHRLPSWMGAAFLNRIR